VILTASSGPAGELVLHVRDRGPGVLPSEREAIFRRFVRGRAGLASPHRGSGIGLSVVRLLIEVMGGRVQVAAHPGGGADFQLVLAGGTIRENTEALDGGTGLL
jgi:two-component system OmpR family sensor kinase